MEKQDVDAIVAMRRGKKLVDVELKPNMDKALEEASLADEKDEIEQSIKRRDFCVFVMVEHGLRL